MTNKNYSAIGLMSGTSLDGLDIAHCNFIFEKDKWSFEIVHAETISYEDEWRNKLSNLENATALEFAKADAELGLYFGLQTQKFMDKYAVTPDFISSHGHTIFHQPQHKFTTQIGSGAAIAAITGIKTVCDFRSKDVFLGGEGAPLVPIGDCFLFSEYDACLNMGGFANITINNGKLFAFDICAANIIINYLVQQLGFAFDEDGKIAAKGEINTQLLEELNELDYYKKSVPKSLGKEWLTSILIPLLDTIHDTIENKLRTIYEHIAIQISNAITDDKCKQVLVTGGGAYNNFLVELMMQKSNTKIIIPNNKIIEFKEALIFAFLGLLRIENKVNCLKDVTGASADNVGGCVYV